MKVKKGAMGSVGKCSLLRCEKHLFSPPTSMMIAKNWLKVFTKYFVSWKLTYCCFCKDVVVYFTYHIYWNRGQSDSPQEKNEIKASQLKTQFCPEPEGRLK